MISRSVVRGATALALVGLATGLVHCHKSDSTGQTAASASSATPPPVAASLAFLESFEGEIDLAMTDKEKGDTAPTPLNVLVKTGKVRVDLPEKLTQGSGFGYGILDTAAKKVSLVSDPRKEVMVIDLNTSGEKLKGFGGSPGAAHPGAPQAPEQKTTLTKTGKTDTVAGYKCEDWDIKSDHREATVCVSDQGASWFQIPLTGIPTERLWMAELLDGKHFPLRLIGYDKTGNTETQRLEVTKIDKKPLDAAQFEYPPTYHVTDLGQMLGAMRGFAAAGGPGGGMGAMGGAGGAPPGMGGAGGAPGMGGAPGTGGAAALPSGFALPPGFKLPPGVNLPPGIKLPPRVTLPPSASASAGAHAAGGW